MAKNLTQPFRLETLIQECGGAAWPLLQTVYSCRTCGHTVHGSCLVNIRLAKNVYEPQSRPCNAETSHQTCVHAKSNQFASGAPVSVPSSIGFQETTQMKVFAKRLIQKQTILEQCFRILRRQPLSCHLPRALVGRAGLPVRRVPDQLDANSSQGPFTLSTFELNPTWSI